MGCPGLLPGGSSRDALATCITLARANWRAVNVADRAVRYGMIVLDAAPTIVRARGLPVFFSSPDETIEYARLHDIGRWMVFGDPEGWWPLYTQDGPVHPPPPKDRVDISLHR